MIRSWREQLNKLATTRGGDLFPLLVFDITPTSGLEWPTELPACRALNDFYTLCDGGLLSIQYRWFPLSELVKETEYWRNALDNYFGDGLPVLLPDRHLVFANDSSGSPVIWDSVDDRVSSFFFKGGSWEPFHMTIETFLTNLFFDPVRVHAGGDGGENDLWGKALQQLNTT